MVVITKSKLLYDYTWAPIPVDDQRVSGEPDDSVLNRREGNQVLYFINKVCCMFNWTSATEGLKMERLIRNVLPNEVVSQVGIKDWLSSNWTKH
jgi:hypothetical protein